MGINRPMADATAQQFNQHWPVGSSVLLITDDGQAIQTKISLPAHIYGDDVAGYEVSAHVAAKPGCIPISQVVPANPKRSSSGIE